METNLLEKCLDFLFPPFCSECGSALGYLCPVCARKTLIPSPEECMVCRGSSEGYETHSRCSFQTYLGKVIICWEYNAPAKHLISQIKTHLHYRIVKTLVEYAAQIARNHLPKTCALVPVPTSRRRIHERGFNQTEVIAKELGRIVGIEVLDILRKIDSSDHQAGKTKIQRAQLDSSEFFLCGDLSIPNRSLVLVDDICTTGATLNACADQLKKAGANEINAFALFRGKNKFGDRSVLPTNN